MIHAKTGVTEALIYSSKRRSKLHKNKIRVRLHLSWPRIILRTGEAVAQDEKEIRTFTGFTSTHF